MGRLGVDASRVLAAARELARKHRHETLEPEHLLAALLSNDRMEHVLSEHAVDGNDLGERVTAHLVDRPTAGLYRDARVEPVPSEALHSLMARAGADRLVTLVRPVSFAQLAQATCSEPRVALLLREASREVGSVKDALAQAKTFALSRREGWVSIFHLFHVLVKQPPMTHALREAHVDRDALLARIVARLDAEPTVADLVAEGLEKKLGGTSQLLAEVLRAKAIELQLAELGASLVEIRRALVRAAGGTSDDDTLPDDRSGDVDIVFRDDDFTTMEFVVQVLHECFAIPADEARSVMLRVHEGRGSAVVRTCPATEARWRVEKGRAHAQRAGMPLRISWRPHTPSE